MDPRQPGDEIPEDINRDDFFERMEEIEEDDDDYGEDDFFDRDVFEDENYIEHLETPDEGAKCSPACGWCGRCS